LQCYPVRRSLVIQQIVAGTLCTHMIVETRRILEETAKQEQIAECGIIMD